MILTIVGANFEGANIGQNKNVTITLNKTGANGSKSSVTLKKGESVSSNTVIATGLSEASGYENLVVTVTMAGKDVSHWFSNANGTVTIPSETKITGNITIKAIASKIATGGGDDVDPEDPGTGGDSIVWYTGYDVLSTCKDESAASYGGFAYNNDAMNNKFVGKQINVISVYISKAGSFTVGIVDSTNNIVDSVVVNISNTGVQTIELNKTLTVNTGCRPFVQAPSDTSKFKYEMSSTISGFPTGMDAYVGVKTIQKFPNYNMNINFGYKQ